MALVTGALAAVLALSAAAYLIVGRGEPTDLVRVRLQSIGQEVPDSFSDSLIKTQKTTLEAYARSARSGAPDGDTSEPPTTTGPSQIRPQTVLGGAAGIYGVDPDAPVADVATLVEQLGEDPSAASAWSDAFGIDPGQIDSTLTSLIPVVLSTDTAFTSHGPGHKDSTPEQVILQAGSPVFIDDHGAPVLDAVSGNPLTAPLLSAGDIDLLGEPWPGFDVAQVTEITPAGSALDEIDAVDIHSGDTTTVAIRVPEPPLDDQDPAIPSTTTTTTTVPPSTTPATQPGSTPPIHAPQPAPAITESRYSDEYVARVTGVRQENLSIRLQFDATGRADLRDPATSCLRITGTDGQDYVARATSIQLTTNTSGHYVGTVTFPALITGSYSFQYSCAGYSLAGLGVYTQSNLGVSRYSANYYSVLLSRSGDTFRFVAHGLGDLREPSTSCITAGSNRWDPTVRADLTVLGRSRTYSGTMTFAGAPSNGSFTYSCRTDYSPAHL